jgi:hypothetical protein
MQLPHGIETSIEPEAKHPLHADPLIGILPEGHTGMYDWGEGSWPGRYP